MALFEKDKKSPKTTLGLSFTSDGKVMFSAVGLRADSAEEALSLADKALRENPGDMAAVMGPDDSPFEGSMTTKGCPFGELQIVLPISPDLLGAMLVSIMAVLEDEKPTPIYEGRVLMIGHSRTLPIMFVAAKRFGAPVWRVIAADHELRLQPSEIADYAAKQYDGTDLGRQDRKSLDAGTKLH